MKRTVPFIALTLALVWAAPALAEEAPEPVDETETAAEPQPDFRMTDWSEDLQLRPNQGWRFGGQALMAPVYFFGGILLHETSHVALGAASGFRVDRFYPHPVIIPVIEHEGNEPERRFYMGLTIFEGRPVDEIEDWQVALTAIAPFMLDTILFLTADLLLEYAVDPHSHAGPFLLCGLMMAPLADFIYGLLHMNEYHDLGMFSEASGIPVGISAGIGWVMAIVGLWRTAHQFRRVFMERVPEGPEEPGVAVSILPIAGEDMTGVGLVGRF